MSFRDSWRVLLPVVAISLASVAEAVNTCTNSGDWHLEATWDGGVPVADQDVVIPATKTVTLSSASAALASLTNAGTLVFTNWDTTLTASNVVVQGTVTLPLAYTNNAMSNRVHFICTNFTLSSTGQINTKGKGYRGGIGTDTIKSGHGPGRGITSGDYYGGGAGHGGRGYKGNTGANGGAYDSTNAPLLPGSGGAGQNSGGAFPGAAGGGAVRIAASDTVTVDGTITADGIDTDWTSGGGSGGSIYITCRVFAGSGSGLLTAKGGRGSIVGNTAGDAGGGRIAVVYDTAAQAAAAKPGVRFNASPGYHASSYHGNEVGNTDLLPTVAVPGTVYLPDNALFKSPFDNFSGRIYGPTNWAVDSLLVTNVSVRFAEPEFSLTVTNTLTIGTASVFQVGSEFDPMAGHHGVSCSDLILTNGGTLYIHSGRTNAAPPNYGGLLAIANGLSIGTNSWLIPVTEPTNGGSVLITVSNVTIAAGGGIDANGRGYRGGYYMNGFGPGRGTGSGQYYYSGGGYGGAGANGSAGTGGSPYGSTNAPIQAGSGGGGNWYGFGGGSVRLQATGAVNVDGTIKANGYDSGVTAGSHGGGGAGGGIFIACNTFTGRTSGRVTADGGVAYPYTVNYGGCGGGGRVSIVLGLSTSDVQKVINGEAVAGLSVLGSYLPYAGVLSAAGGTNTLGRNGGAGTKQFLRVSGGYTLFVAGSPVAYGTPSPYVYGLNVDIPDGSLVTNTVNTPIDEGGGLRRACYAWVVTNAPGVVVTNGAGGEAVLEMTQNLTLIYFWTNEYQLTVSSAAPERGSVNSSTVNGWYTNGVQATGILATASNDFLFSRWSGSVPLGLETNNPLTVTMDQARTLVANFASVYGEAKTWDGTSGLWMDGNRWTPAGVPGPLDQVTIGTGTPMLTEGADIASLAISNGATLVLSNWNTMVTASNIDIAGTVTLPPAYTNGGMSNRVYFLCTNFNLAGSGRIDTTGKGYRGGWGTDAVPYAAGHGPGRGTVSGTHYGGGAGHGGRGYRGPYGVNGDSYDSLTAPLFPGSGGAGLPAAGSPTEGANGGGAVRIAASDTVTIDGTIAADGIDTTWTSGGGSGGSIYITCKTLAGSGLLTAKGGRGSIVGSLAGDGGGGRIAVVYDTAAQAEAAKPGIRFSAGSGYHASSYHGNDVGNTNLLPTVAVPGTLYLPDNVLFKNPFDHITGARIYGSTNWAVDSLLVTNASVVFAEPQFSLTVTNTLTIGTGAVLQVGSEFEPMLGHEVRCRDLILTNGGSLSVYSGPTNASTPNYGGLLDIANDLWIGSNSWITPVSSPTNGGSVLVRAINVTVAAAGGFNANGRGYRGGYYTSGYGQGRGLASGIYYGGGGGYGGTGAIGNAAGAIQAGGVAWGSSNAPIAPGSGGGGNHYGYGGGAVRIEASGAVRLSGTVMADGYHSGQTTGSHGGGGSGGGIFIACRRFSGDASGLLRANGGNGGNYGALNFGGGGGGGRISVAVKCGAADAAKLIAGEELPRLEALSSHPNYAGAASVNYGTDGSGHDGGLGTIRYLQLQPAPGTLFYAR